MMLVLAFFYNLLIFRAGFNVCRVAVSLDLDSVIKLKD